MRLLAHVAFFDAGDEAAAAAAAKAKETSKRGGGVSKSKTSSVWRTFTLNAVTTLLAEMELEYDMFKRVDAVIDVNSLNAFQARLQAWTPPSSNLPRRVFVQVAVHHNLSHPFRTTWAHRTHVAENLQHYDWFLYTEADVFVPATAMRAQVDLALPLYRRNRKLLGFTRMVNDTAGRLFFSDVRRPVSQESVFTAPGLGTFGVPDNSYAAAWAYPRLIMRGFYESKDWLPHLRGTQGMRERAGNGWKYGGIVVRLDDLEALRVFHVGKSGEFYAPHHGFNTLPAERLRPGST